MEMMTLLQKLDRAKFRPLIYVRAQSDKTSQPKIMQHEAELNNLKNCEFHVIFRSREVRQSYLTSVATTLYALLHSLALVWHTRPQLILCNGPGTCVPICWAAFFFRALGLMETRVVFVESFCRVDSLSLSGKLLWPIADRFVVHWRKLAERDATLEHIPFLC